MSDVSTWLRPASSRRRASASASVTALAELERLVEPDRRRDDRVDQLVERRQPEGGEHALAIVGLRAHMAATNAS